MGEAFCLFFERDQLTFCKEGPMGGCGEMPEFSPKSRWCLCGFWLFAVIPNMHSSGVCGQKGGHVHSEVSELEQLHNTFSWFQRRAKLLED